MNSKLKKIANKFKNYENFWHPWCSGAQGVCKFSWFLDIVGARGKKKKQKLARKETWKKCTILFFLARAPWMSFDHEHLHAHLPKKFIIFEFACYFFRIYCSQTYIFIVFSLSRSPGMSKEHENLYASCAPEYIWSHKISDFFRYFFFRIYCSYRPENRSRD